ncbi:protein OSCP1 [Copidosoma floridanum]|uniref:protein OSCP1 n=1 Tax=Copidosoma floridanum TaxID=29053 RepID=UPI0006C9DA13|nr:protein OSCP1 [Copidosoma floridanum]
MIYCATPILYLNMGGEMLYVLQQRLQAQKISPEKTTQVINDVTGALLNPKQLEVVFDRGPLMRLAWLRTSLERVALCSIMKLDDNSSNKLFDLMIMMVKYQLATATGPREVILSTLNHLDAIRDMVMDKKLRGYVDNAHRYIVETYGGMTYKEIWSIRDDCLTEIQSHCVRVSMLLKLGMQNEDTSFNRLIQRYNEKYQERREVLENFKLLDYSEDENVMGSLSFCGNRVTLLGRNIYLPTFGLVPNIRLTRSLHHDHHHPIVEVSNKSMRQEIETLAKQLGKEDTPPMRPFSLKLFGHDDRAAMDCCTPDESAVHSSNKDEDGNLVSKATRDIEAYRTNLITSIDTDFADVEQSPRPQEMDIMNMLDAV